MKGLFLLVVSLYTFGPICVDCDDCLEVDRITYSGPDACQKGTALQTGDVDAKCNEAKQKVQAQGVEIKNAREPQHLKKVGIYTVVGGLTVVPVVAMLVHDNPTIILTNEDVVFYLKN